MTDFSRIPELTRRGFLGALAAPLAASALAACARNGNGDVPADSSPAAGTATGGAAASATAGGAALGLGLQLYTVRDLMAKDLDGTLAALAAAGYRNVETAGYHGRTAQQFKDALSKAGLQAVSMHIPIMDIRGKPQQVMDDAALMGATYIVCPWLEEKDRNPDSYRQVAGDLSKLAEQWTGNGRTVAYHNHDFEFKPVGNTTGYDILFGAASPAVKSELDIYWTVKAGQDPLTVASQHPNRIVLAHAKDAGPAPERTMMDVGKGVIPFQTILPALKAQGLTYAFVEHDNPTDALATVRSSLAHLKSLNV